MLDNVPKNANPNMSRTTIRQERASEVYGEQCIPLLDLPYSASIRSIKLNSTLKSKKSRNLAESLNDHEQHIYMYAFTYPKQNMRKLKQLERISGKQLLSMHRYYLQHRDKVKCEHAARWASVRDL